MQKINLKSQNYYLNNLTLMTIVNGILCYNINYLNMILN